MAKKKSVAKKVANKSTRKKSDKVRSDECPDNVCPIDKKKKKSKGYKVSDDPKSCWGSFLDFIFPSRKKNEQY